MANEFKIKNGYLSEGNSQITGSLIVSGSLTTVGPTTSTQIGAGAAPSGSIPLDVRAQGALSTDLAFRIRNSANNANLGAIYGNGTVNLGNSNFDFQSTETSGRTAIIGSSNTGASYNTYSILSILGHNNNIIGYGHTSYVGINSSINQNSGGTVTGMGESNTLVGGTIGIGMNNNIAGSANSNMNTGIGYNNAIQYEKTNTFLLGNNLRVDKAGAASMTKIGWANSAGTLAQIDRSFEVYLNGQVGSDFHVTGKTNVVLKNNSVLVSGTNYEAAATNTLTIHNGVAPTTNITGAFQLYSSASTAGNAKPYFRTENGTILYLGDQSLLYNVTITGSLGITGSLSNGSGNIASGIFSHAEGLNTISSGSYSHAEGQTTTSVGQSSHAEGRSTTATGAFSHAEGESTVAVGQASHAEGFFTVASGSYQHVQGQYNISSSVQGAFIVGNGTSGAARSNLIFAAESTVQITGSTTILGSLVVNQTATTQSLNTSTRTLFDSSSRSSVSWDNRGLVRSDGRASVDWEKHQLKNTSTNTTTLDWKNEIAYDTTTSSSIYWDTRQLWDADPNGNGYNTASLDWNNRYALDLYANTSIDWGKRALVNSGIEVLNWKEQVLYTPNSEAALNWAERVLYTPNSEAALNWADDTILTSNVYQRDYKSSAIQDTVSNIYNDPDLSYLGDVIEVDDVSTFIDGTVTDGMLVYLNTNATWYPVDQAATVSTKLLGIAHKVSAGTGRILLEGHVVIDDTSTSGPNVQSPDHGLPIYIKNNTTTGLMSTVVPTTTGGPNIVRVLGHCYQQNSGTASQWMMKFRPSNDWVEI